MQNNPIPEVGFLRLRQILGDKKNNIPAIVPVSRSGWYEGQKKGVYPAGINLSKKIVVYRVEDIRALINREA